MKHNQQHQNIDIEQGLLSTLISFNKEVYNVNTILKSKHFLDLRNQNIYQSIIELSQRTRVDVLQVINDLKQKGLIEESGGISYIMEIASKVAGSVDAESYAKIIIEKWINRQVGDICQRIGKEAYSNTADSFELLSELQSEVMTIHSDLDKSINQTIESIVDEFYTDIVDIKIGILNGQPTGLREIDEQFGGYKKGKLYIIAGRPAMGKTAYIVNNIYNLLKQDKKVILHNLEMPNTELFSRLLGLHINESPSALAKGYIQDIKAYEDAAKWFKTRKLHIFNNSNLSNIILNTKMVMSTTGVDAIFIDYLQLVTHNIKKNLTRNDELTIISRTIKSFTVSNKVPIIALAQLSRAVESRPDKMPMLSDLRESGALEQDADVVQFVYRPEYYNIENIEIDGLNLSTTDLCILLTGKHRGGSNKDIAVKWNAEKNRFSDFNEQSKGMKPNLAYEPNKFFERDINEEEEIF
jgi:replicative DNA helicase